jgi:hypothetical protein
MGVRRDPSGRSSWRLQCAGADEVSTGRVATGGNSKKADCGISNAEWVEGVAQLFSAIMKRDKEDYLLPAKTLASHRVAWFDSR